MEFEHFTSAGLRKRTDRGWQSFIKYKEGSAWKAKHKSLSGASLKRDA